MSHASPELDAYLRRIGYRGPEPGPDLQTLCAIHALHVDAIPFENLSPLLGMDVALDLPALRQKLLADGRGGWCFEHNTLLQHALAELGFTVRPLAARVSWNVPTGVVTPRTHMLLHVELDGEPWIADVGFGGMTLSAPLRLVPHLPQHTPHGRFRLEPVDDGYRLEAELPEGWRALYAFDLRTQLPPDFAMANWYLAHYPQSPFISRLMAARAEPGRRHSLLNNRYTVHEQGGSMVSMIEQPEALRRLLMESFGIRLPQHPALESLLKRLAATAP
jgi:N-hydroxyarylamine O-acetyltransferase